MISLKKLVSSEGRGLFLHNDVLTIKKTLEDFIIIDRDITIIIEEGISSKLFDVCHNQEIKIVVKKGASLNYQIVNSKNSKRCIDCYGEVSVTEICLEATKEALKIELLEEQASANIELLSLASTSLSEYNQRIEHKAKHTQSNISNFGVALNQGEIIFDTTGQILKGMAKSKCVQLSKGIVMDDNSVVTSKPILLIDEYDVVANHGASIGKMSDESLFYLMSRGLTKQEAFLLILEGIVGPFIEKIAEVELKTEINQRIEQLMKR